MKYEQWKQLQDLSLLPLNTKKLFLGNLDNHAARQRFPIQTESDLLRMLFLKSRVFPFSQYET